MKSPQTKSSPSEFCLPFTAKIIEQLNEREQFENMPLPARDAAVKARAEIERNENAIEALMTADGDPVTLGDKANALQNTVIILRRRLVPLEEQEQLEDQRRSEGLAANSIDARLLRKAVREYLDCLAQYRLELLHALCDPWESALAVEGHLGALAYDSEQFIPYNLVLESVSGGDCTAIAKAAVPLLTTPFRSPVPVTLDPSAPLRTQPQSYGRIRDVTRHRTDEQFARHAKLCIYQRAIDPGAA